MFPGAVISELGAVIRNVKVGLFIYCDGYWFIYEGLPAVHFTLLLFYLVTFLCWVPSLCQSTCPLLFALRLLVVRM